MENPINFLYNMIIIKVTKIADKKVGLIYLDQV